MAYIDIGNKIKEYRKYRGLNQDELAELASLNRVTIAKYETGKVEPGAMALSRIADALEVRLMNYYAAKIMPKYQKTIYLNCMNVCATIQI